MSILLFLIFSISLSAQNITLSGYVLDAKSGKPLKYANIRVANTTLGTAANAEGKFIMQVPQGSYKIIVSYLGYKSDSVTIKVVADKKFDCNLLPVSIKLNEITVLPKENPALAVIKRAINIKHNRSSKINSYKVNVYTKGSIKTTKDILSSNNSVGVSFGESDTSKLKISGIIENESISYFKKPDNKKEVIIARKQSSNFPPTINIVTGGRIIQNFYDDDLQFFNQPLPGPLSDNAFRHYFYYILDTLAQDNANIFKIYFAPISGTDPGFYGDIYITDKTFNLVKLVVHLNKAANPGGLLTKNTIFQQFDKFDGIYMPVDYRIFADADYLSLTKFGFSLNTIMRNYKINLPINDDFFDKAVVTVLPDADKKDSSYWKSTVPTPYTVEETAAYKRIDSLETVRTAFWQRIHVLARSTKLNDNISISGPLQIYYFNRVSGNALNLQIYAKNYLDNRLNTSLNFSYGFADKKFSWRYKSDYYLGKYRTSVISFDIYNKIADIFGASDDYNLFTSTILSLLTKFEFRDYFYKKGFKISLTSEVLPILQLGIGFVNRSDFSAINNSDFSFFKRNNTYSINPPIFDTKIYGITTNFTLDFRNYIEDGYSRRRTWRGNALPIISGDFYFSNKSILHSSVDFELYRANIYWRIPTFKTADLQLNLNGIYSHNAIPYQMMYALHGNIRSGSKNFTFRTLRIGEVFGDRVLAINLEHNFNDELFRILKIPFLIDLRLKFKVYVNTALSNISADSKSILPRSFNSFVHPFYEVGFGIGQALLPIGFEFTWKLNYRNENNFAFGINTFVF